MNALVPETAPAIERAAEAIVREEGVIDWEVLSERLREHPRGQARAALAAALDVPQMASAIVDHLLTDTLSGDSETLVCGGCGHALGTGDPDDDRNPQAEHASHHAALIRAAMLGTDQ
jgi:hypothetical protein